MKDAALILAMVAVGIEIPSFLTYQLTRPSDPLPDRHSDRDREDIAS